ncbi:MAG: CDP-glycerol glycerophosphotransferase family protein [Patescibacteria group bacterium]
MKTILITISRGGTARNILQSKVFGSLRRSGARLVILTPAAKDQRFLNEFSGDNVFFEDLPEGVWTWMDKILVGWHKGLVYNDSTGMRDLYGIYNPKEGSYLKYLFKKFFFFPLSKLNFLKRLARKLDAHLVKDSMYSEIFEKYKPDLVFSTSIMEDADVPVLKQAKQRGIRTVGMAKTWDNISKMSFRVKTDKLIVWGDYSKNEAKIFQDYGDDEIAVCGIPQFDFYADEYFFTGREEFFKENGLDPNKKLIVFASEGKVSKYDGEVAEIIAGYIKENKIVVPAELFIRPHFMYKGDEEKFKFLAGSGAVIDKGYRHSEAFRDRWDYSKEQIKKFTNLMRYADVVITSASTISLDAAAFDRPVINIAFDGRHKVSYAESIAHWYRSEYYKNVVETGGVWMADGEEELLNAINSCLANPNLLASGREKMRDFFCYKIDGKSGLRIADEVLRFLEE